MSKGSSPPRLVVRWDPDRQLWMKVPPQPVFFELPEPYSETWPASGSMRNGICVPRPTSAPPTAGDGSSSSLGPALLPTPTTSEGRGPGAPEGYRNDTLRARIANLPTPRARDSKGTGYEDGLPNVVQLLKTPTAQLAVNGGSQHPDKRKAGGHGPTLADEVEHLLPTPTRSDATNTANFRPDGTPYSSGYGMTLTDAARLLPTPTAADGDQSTSTYMRGNPTLRGACTSPPSDAGSPSSDAQRPGRPTLWDG